MRHAEPVLTYVFIAPKLVISKVKVNPLSVAFAVLELTDVFVALKLVISKVEVCALSAGLTVLELTYVSIAIGKGESAVTISPKQIDTAWTRRPITLRHSAAKAAGK